MADSDLSPVTEIAVRHFKGLEDRWLDIPEWRDADDKPVRIYWTPWTTKEMRDLGARTSDDDRGQNVDILIFKALDKDGKKMFTLADKQKLLRQTHDRIIVTIATVIMVDVMVKKGVDPVESASGN